MTVDEKLNDVLNIDGELEKPTNEIATVENDSQPDLDEDFAQSREKTQEILNKGTQALQRALMVAGMGDDPRAYRVVAELITALSGVNKDLLIMHEKYSKINNMNRLPEKQEAQVNNVTQNILLTTADLLRQIETQGMKEIEGEVEQEEAEEET